MAVSVPGPATDLALGALAGGTVVAVALGGDYAWIMLDAPGGDVISGAGSLPPDGDYP